MKRVVIEITPTSIRALVVAGPRRQPRVEAFLVEPLAGASAAVEGAAQNQPAAGPVKEALHRILSRVPRKPASVIYAMPREQAITRMLKLPSVRPDEVAQMVALASQTQLPFPRDQAIVDFQVIDQQAGSSTVQVVACHHDVVERSLALFRQEGREPSWVVPSSWGCLAWYQRLGRSLEAREPVLLMDIDDDHVELALIRQDRLLFSRSLSQGVRASSGGSDVATALAQELERSLFSLMKEVPGVEITSGVVTGVGPLESWRQVLAQRLGKPVVIKPAFGAWRSPATSSMPPVSPVVLLGLATAEDGWLINLLPQAVRQAQSHQRRMKELTLTGALVVASLLAGAWLLSIRVTRQTQAAGQTLHQMKQLEVVAKQLEQKEQEIRLVDAILASRRGTAAMLAELFRLTPAETFLESLTFERARGECLVRGSAPTTREVLDYLQHLKQAGPWDRADLRYSSRRNIAGVERTDFEIVLHVSQQHSPPEADAPLAQLPQRLRTVPHEKEIEDGEGL